MSIVFAAGKKSAAIIKGKEEDPRRPKQLAVPDGEQWVSRIIWFMLY